MGNSRDNENKEERAKELAKLLYKYGITVKVPIHEVDTVKTGLRSRLQELVAIINESET